MEKSWKGEDRVIKFYGTFYPHIFLCPPRTNSLRRQNPVSGPMNGGACEGESASLTFVTLHVCFHRASAYFACSSRHWSTFRKFQRRVRDLGEAPVLCVEMFCKRSCKSRAEWREHSWSSHLNPAHSLYGGGLTTAASPAPTDVMASSDGQTIKSKIIVVVPDDNWVIACGQLNWYDYHLHKQDRRASSGSWFHPRLTRRWSTSGSSSATPGPLCFHPDSDSNWKLQLQGGKEITIGRTIDRPSLRGRVLVMYMSCLPFFSETILLHLISLLVSLLYSALAPALDLWSMSIWHLSNGAYISNYFSSIFNCKPFNV